MPVELNKVNLELKAIEPLLNRSSRLFHNPAWK